MNVLTIFSNICLCTTKILFGIILLLPKELPLQFYFPLGLQIMIFFSVFVTKVFILYSIFLLCPRFLCLRTKQ